MAADLVLLLTLNAWSMSISMITRNNCDGRFVEYRLIMPVDLHR